MILDSDILIDILRGHPPAVEWLTDTASVQIVSGIAAVELAYGAKDTEALKTVNALLERFTIEWPHAQDVNEAYRMAALHLSHGLNGPDAITSAIALRVGLPIATFNVKHFRAVPSVVTVQPYSR